MTYEEIFNIIKIIDRKLDFICPSSSRTIAFLIYIEHLPEDQYNAIKEYLYLLEEGIWMSVLSEEQQHEYEDEFTGTIEKIYRNGISLQNAIIHDGFYLKEIISKRGIEMLFLMLVNKNPEDFYLFSKNRKNWSRGELLYYMEKYLLTPELTEYVKTELFSEDNIKEYKRIKIEQNLRRD